MSNVTSRSSVDVSTHLGSWIFKTPIIPANMQAVASTTLLKAQIVAGGLAIMHRFQTEQEQINQFWELTDQGARDNVAVSIGVKESDFQTFNRLFKIGTEIVCLDIAHAHSQKAIDAIKYLKSQYDVFVIAGNIATTKAAYDLFEAGADCLKIGIGPGSICTTRIETGHGVGQFSAICEASDVRSRYFPDRYLVADGGIQSAGDIVKCLSLVDFVMIGNLFAGTNEAPGKLINKSIEQSHWKKEYAGSSTLKDSRVEGVTGYVKYQGSFNALLQKLIDGIQSGCSYAGVHSVKDLQKNPEFQRITAAGLRESHPHDLV